jgi:hypothetical protein
MAVRVARRVVVACPEPATAAVTARAAAAEAARHRRPVVVTSDEASRRATRRARAEPTAAAARGAELTVVYIAPEDPEAAFGTVDPFAYDPEAAAAEADRLVAEALAGRGDAYPDVVVRRHAEHDPAVAWPCCTTTATRPP